MQLTCSHKSYYKIIEIHVHNYVQCTHTHTVSWPGGRGGGGGGGGGGGTADEPEGGKAAAVSCNSETLPFRASTVST